MAEAFSDRHAGDAPAEYRSTFRNSETAVPALALVVVLAAAAIAGTILLADADSIGPLMLLALAGAAFGMLAVLLSAFRLHRWTIRSQGVRILERPRIPMMGFARHAELPYAAIAALRDVESGFDRQIEILARDGRRFRIAQAMVRGRGERYGRPDPAAPLHGYAVAIRAAAAQAGHALAPGAQGLSFWNTGAGLALLAGLFAVSVAPAIGVGIALSEGLSSRQPRGGEAIAIMLLLPVGAGWLWLRSFRRRRAVLRLLGPEPPAPRRDGQSAP